MCNQEIDTLKKQIHSLEQEVLMLNEQINKFEIIRSEFLSNIRNEIVNPFSSIQILSKMIIKSPKDDWKSVISMAALIQKEALMLDFHLKNIFAAAELESGESVLKLCRTRIVEVFNDIIELFEPLANKKKAKINLVTSISEEDYIICDAEKIRLILANLITNSIHACSLNSEIIVELQYDENNQLKFSVLDTGIGISEDAKYKIFNRFKKLDESINSENPGLGIGLSVVLSCVELLNGEISFQSEKEKFTLFNVLIPLDYNPELYTNTIESDNELMFF